MNQKSKTTKQKQKSKSLNFGNCLYPSVMSRNNVSPSHDNPAFDNTTETNANINVNKQQREQSSQNGHAVSDRHHEDATSKKNKSCEFRPKGKWWGGGGRANVFACPSVGHLVSLSPFHRIFKDKVTKIHFASRLPALRCIYVIDDIFPCHLITCTHTSRRTDRQIRYNKAK